MDDKKNQSANSTHIEYDDSSDEDSQYHISHILAEDSKASSFVSSETPYGESLPPQPIKSKIPHIFNLKQKRKNNTKAKSKQTKKSKACYGNAPSLEEKYQLLTPSEAEILRTQTHSSNQSANIFTLYKFATLWDVFMVLLGVLSAIVHGVALPMTTLVVESVTNNLNDYIATGDLTEDGYQQNVNGNALYFVYIGVAMLVSSILESAILAHEGEKLAGRYRKNYLKSIIRQNIAYFDYLGAGQVATRITNDTSSIQEAISEKLGNVVQGISTFVAAIIIAFIKDWKLSCILLSVVGFNIIVMGGGSKLMVKYQLDADTIYTEGSSVAEEALSSIKSTVSLGAQHLLAQKFDKVLLAARKPSERAGVVMGLVFGGVWMALFMTYALAYWMGSRMIVNDSANIGSIFCVIIAMRIGSFQLGNVAPNIRFVAKGIAACKTINEAINRTPIIDSENSEGGIPQNVKGNIEFSNVKFRYPSRPDVLVLPNFSLSITSGSTVALVGSSGSGKSTIFGILERFYLPLSGQVTLDGVEIQSINLKWLRRQIGYVQQEPTLFAESIYDNVANGLIGTEYEFVSEDKKRLMVANACKEANAYDFIQSLANGFDTDVGDRGFLLSGGQKQRIAIARAIVSNPKILLLDEATSALDTKSEGIVQEALDRASVSRTTIVIAHRLSTIKDADNIVVMNKGEILEQGTHRQLLDLDGHYKKLVDTQKLHNQPVNDYNAINQSHLPIKEDNIVTHDTHDPVYGNSEEIPGVMRNPKDTIWDYIKMIWSLNKDEKIMLVCGCIFMVLQGYCYCGMGQVTAHTIKELIVPPPLYPQMRHNINILCWWFFFIGMTSYICTFIGLSLITVSSARLIRKIRLQIFKQLMRLDMAFFDHKDNSSGALTSVLAKEAKAIEGLGGVTFGQIMTSMTILIGGIATGIAYSWRVGLVATATVPILLACGFIRVKVMIGLEERGRVVYERYGAMASQYTHAVRTVQSLTVEDNVVLKYTTAIERQIRCSCLPILRSGILYGISQGFVPWVVALIYWYGSTCLRKGQVKVLNYYVVFMCITLGAQAAGQLFSYAPDIGKVREAGANISQILYAQPKIDVSSPEGHVVETSEVQGDLELRNVWFRYPTRPEVPVLNGVNLKVEKGQFIALVGASGCGKSTTIGLIERFYDTQRGSVLFDGRDIREYNLGSYRSHIALVQQEPTLYSGTLRENIAMGWPGNINDVTDEMVCDAARKANIHHFIMSLPDGYNTVSGSRGSLLSGGQKQRMAIARALIRNPKVLLLDEATSALDSESEKVVQSALDKAARGRTTIAIAHRLSTIQKADIIYVFDCGKIVEQGDHTSLLELNGRYAELVKLQSLEG